MSCSECIHSEVCAYKNEFESFRNEVESPDSIALRYYNDGGIFTAIASCKKFCAKPQIAFLSSLPPAPHTEDCVITCETRTGMPAGGSCGSADGGCSDGA